MNKKRYTTLDDLPLTLRVEEVAAVLGIGRNTAYQLVRGGTLHGIRIRRQLRIPKSELVRFLSGKQDVDFPC